MPWGVSDPRFQATRPAPGATPGINPESGGGFWESVRNLFSGGGAQEGRQSMTQMMGGQVPGYEPETSVPEMPMIPQQQMLDMMLQGRGQGESRPSEGEGMSPFPVDVGGALMVDNANRLEGQQGQPQPPTSMPGTGQQPQAQPQAPAAQPPSRPQVSLPEGTSISDLQQAFAESQREPTQPGAPERDFQGDMWDQVQQFMATPEGQQMLMNFGQTMMAPMEPGTASASRWGASLGAGWEGHQASREQQRQQAVEQAQLEQQHRQAELQEFQTLAGLAFQGDKQALQRAQAESRLQLDETKMQQMESEMQRAKESGMLADMDPSNQSATFNDAMAISQMRLGTGEFDNPQDAFLDTWQKMKFTGQKSPDQWYADAVQEIYADDLLRGEAEEEAVRRMGEIREYLRGAQLGGAQAQSREQTPRGGQGPQGQTQSLGTIEHQGQQYQVIQDQSGTRFAVDPQGQVFRVE